MVKSFRFTPLLVALAASAACVPAFAQSFTANEGSVPGAAPNIVSADRVSFNYLALINQTMANPGFTGSNPFTESGYLTKASFANGGTAVSSQLNALAPAGYGIYGLFNIAGTATVSGGGFLATFSTATLSLFLDPNQDTTLAFSGGIATTMGGTADDKLLATYTLNQGQAHIFAGLAKGDFNTILNLTLTPTGQAFFNNPSPFYTLETFGGNTQTLTGASLTSPFTASATGAGTEIFQPVPEPETYALMLAGLGALGFVASRRRRS